MSIPGSANPLLLATAAAAAETFQISRSLRFDSGSTSSLTKTFSSNGDRQKWTFSFWIKRSKLGTKQQIFGVQGTNDSDYSEMYFDTDDKLFIRFGYLSVVDAKPAAVFRDVGAWMHIVIALDTQNSTANDRLRVYVNGTELDDYSDDSRSSFTGTYGIGRAGAHKISGEPNGSGSHIDGYMTEIHYVNGSQKAPTDFGVLDSDNNWNPKEYSGTYGTNGFYLKCADNTSSASLGTDSSGNSNTFTVNNLVADAPGLGTSHQGFDAVTYSGNGGTQSISSLNFQPDLVWLKETGPRNNVSHQLYDVVRGTSKMLQSDNNGAEATISGVTGFTSNGFNLGSNGGGNNSGSNYVAWCWKADGAGSALNTGSINATVSANTTYGFSIIKYEGTGSNGTVAHGLGAVPKMFIGRNLEDTSGSLDWIVYHESVGNTGRLKLNTTGDISTSSTFFQDTSPTDSLITIGTSNDINKDNDNYILYCWSEISGFSKFGTYSGLSTTLGPKVVTGFKPKLVVVKRTDAAGNWTVYDSARSLDKDLKWNTHESEGTAPIIFHSDGFQLNYNTGSVNTSGGSYIYMAFASKPDGIPIDSLIDTPTNADADSGNNIGNHCTWNFLKPTNGAYSEGNLKFVGNNNWCHTPGTFLLSSGKWYFEGTYKGSQFGSNQGNIVTGIGFIRADAALGEGSNQEPVNNADFRSNTLAFYQNGYFTNLSTHSSVRSQIAEGDVVGVSIDFDAGTYAFYVNNSSVASGSLSYTGPFLPWTHVYYNNSFYDCNFGARPFAYTPPTGHKSLCTQNLTDPTIADGSTAMDAKLYTGNGSTQTISGLGFSPDLVWMKMRSTGGYSHKLVDQVRGATKSLVSNNANAELTETSGLTAFTSDGFSLGSQEAYNRNNDTFVAWTWDAGSSTDTNNTAGSITPAGVRANASAGFSIVTWTGQSSGSATIGHGLNAAPEFIILKGRTGSVGWTVGHESIGWTKRLKLNGTDAESTSSNYWNDTAPTASVFTAGANNVNNTFVAYCFAPVAGHSAFGSYIGNGSSSDGPFVFTGFRVALLAIKRTDSTGAWKVLDTSRSPFNVAREGLDWNTSGSEFDNSENDVDILSNGFKLKTSHGARNASGGTFVYMAWAEHPFKTARAR